MTDNTEHNDPFDAAYENLPEDAKGDEIVAFVCAVIATYSSSPGDAKNFLYEATLNLERFYMGEDPLASDVCNCPRCTARREAEATKH